MKIQSKERKVFNNFIKIVFSHEAIQYAELNKVIRQSDLLKIIPEVPSIFNKQVSPAATMFCNYSKASCNIPENAEIFLSTQNCP